MGMTPASYAKRGRGARIAFTIIDSTLGRLLVAATERGLCAVFLGESDSYLESELHKDYPEAEIHHDNGRLSEWTASVLDYLDGRLAHPDLPLDVRATAFQWQVWKRLQAIPRGSTLSYNEIAKDLGRPKAARAVGGACATNPVSVIVPCHRAMGSNGKPTGYRWGIDRKKRFLEIERASAAPPNKGNL